MDNYDHQETEEHSESKSQRKREMLALQALGETLVELSAEQFSKIHLPEDLHEAVLAARNIHQHGARKRQLQYIGKLMRRVDAEPIQQQIDTLLGCSQQAAQELHRIEGWRDRLLAEGDHVLEELLGEHQDADRQYLRQLMRNAKKEALENKPPKSARGLFRYLRELINK